MRPQYFFIRAASFAGLLLIAGSAHCAVRASVDSNSVGANGTIELMLEHDGQTSAEPDLSPLKEDFDVLSSSRSSNVQIVNGSMTSSARVELSLSPKHSGQIRIPAIAWGNEKSDPISVSVNAASSGSPQTPGASSGSAKVYLKTSIEPQQSYVQAGIDLTVRLYSAVPLYHAELELPADSDVLVQQVGADRNETVVENGERYQVVERHYELFPQRSGSLKLSGPALNAQIPVQNRMDPFGNSFKDFFGNIPFGGAFTTAKPLRLHGDDIALNVLPRPAAAGGEYWLPAQDVTLQGEWRPAQGPIKAGDPVTLDLHLKARGLTAAQLPDLNALLKLPPGVKAYPDQAKLTNDAQGGNLEGRRDQSIALIADRAGEFTIPALSVHWWDTKTNEARETTLPARTLSFAPGADLPSANPPAAASSPALTPREQTPASTVTGNQKSDSASNPTWFWVSVGLAVLWVITLVAWYLNRRRPERQPAVIPDQRDATAAEARRRFVDACRRNDARAARASLLQWIGTSNADKRFVNLRSFARTAGQPGLAQLLEDLDRACYAGGKWQGTQLMEALDKLPATRAADRAPREELEPLYKS